MTGDVYGLASDPDAGIDEIRFTIGLDPCSPALDLTKVQIVYSTPGTFPVYPHLRYQDLYRFFHRKNRYCPGHFTESR